MAIQYSEDAIKAMNLAQERIVDHVVALGDLVVVAGALEPGIDRLFVPILQCSVEQVACLMTGIESLPPRCEMLKRLIYLEQLSAPEAKWRDWFTSVLDRVAQEICASRNRFIHDHWRYRPREGDMVKKSKKARLQNTPPGGHRNVVFDGDVVVNTHEVEKLVMRIELINAVLASSFECLTAWRSKKGRLTIDSRLAPAVRRFARYSTLREREQAHHEGKTLPDFLFD